MSNIMLSATGIHKTYKRALITSVLLQERILKPHLRRKRIQVDALKDVSLDVHRGEWVGIYGHNGSGKTTLLRILAGLLQADAGQVTRQGSISCFFELGIGFHPERCAEENIYLNGLLQGFSKKQIREMTQRIIDFAGVGSHVHLPIKCYSTGMKMRLAFAAAAQIESDVYLLDEVLAVGDVAFQHQCLTHMRQMRREGKTVVLVSHGIDSLEHFCDRIITLENGGVSNVAYPDRTDGDVKLERSMDILAQEMARQRMQAETACV